MERNEKRAQHFVCGCPDQDSHRSRSALSWKEEIWSTPRKARRSVVRRRREVLFEFQGRRRLRLLVFRTTKNPCVEDAEEIPPSEDEVVRTDEEASSTPLVQSIPCKNHKRPFKVNKKAESLIHIVKPQGSPGSQPRVVTRVFLVYFPDTWTFDPLLKKHDQAPTLETLYTKTVELAKNHPDFLGAGHHLRPIPKMAAILTKASLSPVATVVRTESHFPSFGGVAAVSLPRLANILRLMIIQHGVPSQQKDGLQSSRLRARLSRRLQGSKEQG